MMNGTSMGRGRESSSPRAPSAVAPRVLFVDDDPSLCALLQAQLTRRNFEVQPASSASEALRLLDDTEIDVVLTDVVMEGMDGLQLCSRIAADRPQLPVVILTASERLETAIGAIRAGAYDFVTKPIDFEVLSLVLERAVKQRRLAATVERLSRALEEVTGFEEIVGESPAMRNVFALLARVTQSEASVLITGESGTGKELVARALHRRGPRSAGPFVAVNCAAIPETLLESELFGHARGAFTDARAARTGLFVQANGGTLLLDEIGDLPIGLQPKLLRALQERVIRPVGGDAEVPFDVRLITDTNQELRAAVDQRRFREDLFFRVAVIHIELPPLRARGTDVLLLAQRFVERYGKHAGKRVRSLSRAAAERLLDYPWPGNVRELQNCIERAVALTMREEIGVEDLPEHVRAWRRKRPALAAGEPGDLAPLEEVDRRHILRVFEAVGRNQRRAAQLLGIDRKTLAGKLARYGARERPRRRAHGHRR